MTAARRFDEAGIKLDDISLRRPSLDDVFLAVTGHAAAANAEAAPQGTAAAAAEGGAHETAGAAPPPIQGARPMTPLVALGDIIAVTKRNVMHLWRVPQLLFFSSVQPVMFVLLFRYVFGGAIQVPGGKYVNYLLPGIFIQIALFGGASTAVGLATDIKGGIIDRMRTLPMARSAVLAGRTFADLVRNVLVVALMLVVGTLVGFRFMGSPAANVLGVSSCSFSDTRSPGYSPLSAWP